MARDFDRQVVEFQLHVAVLNGFTALGIPVTETVGQVWPEKGKSACHPICATEPRTSIRATMQNNTAAPAPFNRIAPAHESA